MDMTGWWFFAYPSEKWWSESQLGLLVFPTEWKHTVKFHGSKPPTSIDKPHKTAMNVHWTNGMKWHKIGSLTFQKLKKIDMDNPPCPSAPKKHGEIPNAFCNSMAGGHGFHGLIGICIHPGYLWYPSLVSLVSICAVYVWCLSLYPTNHPSIDTPHINKYIHLPLD